MSIAISILVGFLIGVAAEQGASRRPRRRGPEVIRPTGASPWFTTALGGRACELGGHVFATVRKATPETLWIEWDPNGRFQDYRLTRRATDRQIYKNDRGQLTAVVTVPGTKD